MSAKIIFGDLYVGSDETVEYPDVEEVRGKDQRTGRSNADLSAAQICQRRRSRLAPRDARCAYEDGLLRVRLSIAYEAEIKAAARSGRLRLRVGDGAPAVGRALGGGAASEEQALSVVSGRREHKKRARWAVGRYHSAQVRR